LECKAASPSKGLIVKNYQPEKLVDAYESFAAAISVLTDEKFFNGKMSDLKLVSETTELPVLCKDFFISKQQILCARENGADAILLMLSVLDDSKYTALVRQAESLNLDVLTEVHDHQELDRAIALDAKIIGINNRNLGTLEIDMVTTTRLIKKIPASCLVISESGYHSRSQLVAACNGSRRPDGFLIGSHLSAAKNPHQSLRELVFGRVKICGLTSIEDAKVAYHSGAIYGGLIFAKNSPRYIESDSAQKIIEKVALRWVGVFTQTDNHSIVSLAEELNLFAVQIHFQMSPERLTQLRLSLPECCEIWQLVNIDPKQQKLPSEMANVGSVQRYIIEPIGELAGGNGQKFDWDILLDANLDKTKIILAGGVNPENVSQAIATGVDIVDVNSGVENYPGEKSTHKIKQLFKQLLPGNKI